MKLTYLDAAKTTIRMELDEGESFGNIRGPGTSFVPLDPANFEYSEILRQQLRIAPFTGEPTAGETREPSGEADAEPTPEEAAPRPVPKNTPKAAPVAKKRAPPPPPPPPPPPVRPTPRPSSAKRKKGR